MFELVAGHIDRPFRDRHTGPTIVSLAVHGTLVGAVVGAFMFAVNQTLPEVPTIIAFVADVPPPAPPPPPAPAAVQAQKPDAPRPAPTAGQLALAAPSEAPIGIHAESGLVPDEGGGVIGGVEGGIAGGVVGGLISRTEVEPPPPPPPAPAKPVRVGGNMQTPALIHRVEPVYPPIAVSAKVTGIVVLEATVNEKGDVVDVAILRSLPLLDKAAMEAIRQWKYQPLMMNGVPSPFMLTVTLTFAIR
jgi:protein TonB